MLLRALRDPRRGGPSPLARGLAVLVVAGLIVASGAIVLVPLLRWVVETLL